MKQAVKLNEEQLRKVVAESVQKILNELDWKTYANAARKAKLKGDDREDAFADAARNRFNKDYGYYKYNDDSDPDFPEAPSYSSDSLHYSMGDINGDNITSFADQGWSYGEDWGDDFRGKYDFSPSSVSSHETRDPDGREIDPWLNTAKNVGNKEIEDYITGKYGYQKSGLGFRGKGWHLKESVIKRIVSESIQKVLGKNQ